ncbi:MAG: FRG domain-containing protein [Alphaproteobacteria bacterium]|jgi:hypothetical protein|nr:FRG domain-containing protein [Alphaproteobacteria bacterium]
MEFHASSADEALEICRQLVRNGQANLFRGQTQDWPKITPSLHRIIKEEQDKAIQELKMFEEWSGSVPGMAVYRHKKEAITAIAQHFQIPTSFLDMTTSPEIALLFAKSSSETDDHKFESVIYCFTEEMLKTLPGGKLIKIEVSNLWRLEAQKGLFLQFLNEELSDILPKHTIKVYFPSCKSTAHEQIKLYPARKSPLECVIDQWIYRRQIEHSMDAIPDSVTKTFVRRQTFSGIFRWRAIPELDGKWIDHETGWLVPPIESVSILSSPIEVSLPLVDLSTPQCAQKALAKIIEASIRQHLTEGQLIVFKAHLSDSKSQLANSVSTLINRCWDGLRALPYDVKELTASLALTTAFLIARTEEVSDIEEWPKHLWDEVMILETAPVGGHIEAGLVSKKDLSEAFSRQYFDRMTAYMRRKYNENPEILMQYVVDNWILFKFKAFKKLFVEQYIPTVIDAYWQEDLELYKGTLGCMWSPSFNPALLGYVTNEEFRFRSPIALEHECDRLIFISPDMEKSDLEELFVSCLPNIFSGGQPYEIKFSDYSGENPEVWEIDRVLEQSQWIIEVGGISVLDVFPTVKFEEMEENNNSLGGMGAFEVWLMSKGLIAKMRGVNLKDHDDLLTKFFEDLAASNNNLEARARQMPDWPMNAIEVE